MPRACGAHKKRWTIHNSENDRRPAILVSGGVADDRSHGRTIVVLQPATERVRQKFFSDRSRKLLGLFEQQRPQSREALERRAAGRRAARVDGLARFVDGAPAANHVEILQREPERIDGRMTTVTGG